MDFPHRTDSLQEGKNGTVFKILENKRFVIIFDNMGHMEPKWVDPNTSSLAIEPGSMVGFQQGFHRSNFCGCLRCADTDVIQCTEGSIACIDGNQAQF